jgi:uncharacterized protein YggU (UPF0235/DUF167 family)
MVRLTPKSSRDGVDGVKPGADGPLIHARVRAVPEDGRANTALVALIAAEIGVAKSAVTVASGHTSRLKSLHVAGDPGGLERRIAGWLKRIE